jgi:YD repeat-containing protein
LAARQNRSPARPSRGRSTRRVASVVLGFAFIAQALSAVPPSASAQDSAADQPAADAAAIAVDAQPIPDSAREPVDAPVDHNGVLDPALVEITPGSGATVAEVISDEIPVPESGDTQIDAYAPEQGVGDHFAVVSAAIFNAEDPSGEWRDAALLADDYGWSLSTGSFTVRFPKELSPSTPVVYETGAGSVSAVPVGVLAAPGTATGTTVTYAGALPGTDLVYEVSAEGYKETLVLSKGAAGKLAWDLEVTGFALALGSGGEVQVTLGGATVARMPAPVATDSAPEPATTTPTWSLTAAGAGSYTLLATLDPLFLASATYPVVVDPGTLQDAPSADAYVNKNQGGNNFGTETTFRTGPSGSYLAFVKFPTTWHTPGRLIYSAELWVKNISEASGGANVIAKRVTAGWNETGITWNNKPAVSTTPNPQNTNAPTGDWFVFQLKNLYQLYNDGTYPDYGVRLESTDDKRFHAKEGACTPSCDPYLLLSYNDLPNSPNLDTPADARAFETTAVTLRINQVPGDPNSDEVLVRYQVTGVQGDWSVAESSAWTDEHTFEVPSGWLNDGGTYWWRVQAADVCTQPDTLCSNTDGTGATVPWPVSPERSFTILKKNWGTDPRYAMWSEEIGNGVTLSVNEANGNMVLEVPIDKVRTPLGQLSVGLTYNSQAAEKGIDKGMGPGWKLYAGPSSSGRQLPTEIEELTPAPYEGVKVHLRGGGHEFYPWRGGNSYSTVGAGSGVVRKNANGTWTYRGADGDVYTFDAAGRLDKAKPVTTKAKVAGVANPNYRYTFNAQAHLTKVSDPIDREITFDWTGTPEKLTAVHVFGHDFTIEYISGTISKVTTPVGETIRVYTNDLCGGENLIDEVRTGEQFADALPGWRLNHVKDTAPANTSWHVCRVNEIFPPQPAGGTTKWVLAWGAGGYKGTTSLTTRVTDPRGVATGTPVTDYRTTIDFNYSGLPIRIVAPEIVAADPDWITSMVWDSNGNLLCSRAPQANALDQTQCQGADQTHQYNTEYAYETTEPFRLLEVTDPAPTSGAVRASTAYEYDGGGTFTGLWAEEFENPNLAGVPDDEGLWTDLNQNWSTGAPGGIGSNDNWSVRLGGFLDVGGTQAKTYEFRVTSDDGVTLVVGNKVLLNCFGITFSGQNCGQGIVKKKLWPGPRPITIEYQEKTGSAQLKVEWDQGTGNWQVIPAADLLPNLGLTTKVTRGPDAAGSNLTLETRFGYPSDTLKARRLPSFREREDIDPGYTGSDDLRRSEFTYDDYGRRTVVIRFADKVNFAATTQRFYTDDPVLQTSCLTKVISPTGAVTEYTCNKWGDVTQEKRIIRDVTVGGTQLQVSENRITDTTYDKMGRPKTIDLPGPALETYTYDLSGRVLTHAVLLDDLNDANASNDLYATTIYAYDDHATPNPTMTETLPDPDRGGSQYASPVVIHRYDYAGNEIERTDPRNQTWVWKTTYDAQSRVVQELSPDPDGTGGNPELTTTTTYSVDPYQTSVSDLTGVATVTSMDQLGRVTQTQSGVLAPTVNSYNAIGGLTRVEVSYAGTIFTWRTTPTTRSGRCSPTPGPGTTTRTPRPRPSRSRPPTPTTARAG